MLGLRREISKPCMSYPFESGREVDICSVSSLVEMHSRCEPHRGVPQDCWCMMRVKGSLTRAYFAFLEVLFNSHMTFISDLDTSTFMHIVSSLESGLKGLDSSISTQCAAAIDNLAAFYFNNITMGDAPTSPAAINLARQIAERPCMFAEILKTLFEIVLFEDCGNQWSLSRPMLSLILISEQVIVNSNDIWKSEMVLELPKIREILPQYEICCLNFDGGSISETSMH
ncbi:hypothetical protein RJ639_032455, partial [Escallonia herrerae]